MRADLEGHRRDECAARGRSAPAPRPSSRASRRRRSTWRAMLACASASITGPTSVASRAGSPTAARPARRAASRSRRRRCRRARTAGAAPSSAGRRERKALCTTASTTCSGSARAVDDHRVEAAGLGDQRHDRAVLRGQRAVDVPRHLRAAGEADAGGARVGHQRGADASRRGRAAAPARRPARRRRAAARRSARATDGVCSAGLAATALPAASAAATWPAKIASGKFHGLMQTNTPRPCRRSGCSRRSGRAASARPGASRLRRRSSGRSRPPRAPRRRSRRASCAPSRTSRPQNSGRRASSASAARAQHARRARRPGAAFQAAKPACSRAIAASTVGRAAPRPRAATGSRPRAPLESGARIGRHGQVDAGGVAPRRRRTAPPAAAAPGAARGLQRRRQQRVEPAPHRRRAGARTTSWRRSPAGAAPGRPAGRGARRPARRRAPARRASCSTSRYTPSPMPCRRCISKAAPRARAICTMAAMVPALWVANCG